MGTWESDMGDIWWRERVCREKVENGVTFGVVWKPNVVESSLESIKVILMRTSGNGG